MSPLKKHRPSSAWCFLAAILLLAALACRLPEQVLAAVRTATPTIIPANTPPPSRTPTPSLTPTATDTPLPSPTAFPTATRTRTPTRSPTPTLPTLTPAPNQLAAGQDSWTLIGYERKVWMTFLEFTVSPAWYNRSPVGYQFLRLIFRCDTGRSLIALYTGAEQGSTMVHNRQGYPDLFLQDAGGKRYRITMIGTCFLAAPVPPDRFDFTLFFQQLPPLTIHAP